MSGIPFEGFVWVPIVIFILVILVGSLLGFLVGWKTSTYFLLGNIILGIAGIFIYGAIYDAWISSWINNMVPENINLTPLLGNIRPYAEAVTFIAIFLVINIILGIIYIFLRKYLKMEKGETVNPKKVLRDRLIGMTVSSATGFVIAVSASASATAVFDPMSFDGNKSKFANFNSSTMKVMSFGKMYNPQNIQRLIVAVDLFKNKDEGALGVLVGIINNGGESLDDAINKQVDNWNKDKKKMQMVLGDPELFEKIIEAIPADKIGTEIKMDFFQTNVQPIVERVSSLNLSNEIQELFKEFLFKNITVEINKDPEINNKENIINFLSCSLLGNGSLN